MKRMNTLIALLLCWLGLCGFDLNFQADHENPAEIDGLKLQIYDNDTKQQVGELIFPKENMTLSMYTFTFTAKDMNLVTNKRSMGFTATAYSGLEVSEKCNYVSYKRPLFPFLNFKTPTITFSK